MTDRTQHCPGCKERQDRIEALTAAVKEAIEAVENQDMNARMCCNGYMCGCYGVTNADLLLHSLRAALKGQTDE
ncbi:MAG: hypothetical protein WCY11_05140 [Novosphingobium sp.]